MKICSLFLILCLAGPGLADVVVPTRTIRANAIISDLDVTISQAEAANGFGRLRDVIGQEARIVLYTGRSISIDDIGPPAIISRNQIVPLIFEGSGLRIMTEGRALERGAIGDLIRVMNLDSRSTVLGQVMANGAIKLQK